MAPNTLVLVATLAVLAVGTHVAAFLLVPIASGGDPIRFEIAERESLASVAARLARDGVIHNRFEFVLLGRVTGRDRRLQAGEYALQPSMRPLEILDHFWRGTVVLHPVTIPEGYTVRQIADAFGAAGIGDPDALLGLAESPEFARELGVEAPTLEGYLFPDTYALPRRIASADILRRMVERFREVYQAEWASRAADMGLTQHQVVTLASIIEKETGAGHERPTISAVFHNRLRMRMPLQSDPTVIYPIKNFDGNLRKVDLIRDTPYNTYRRRGLPPGPIANPGRDALEAALYPAGVDYLFFVARNDGTHQFSRTLREHNRAVNEFQRRGRRAASQGA
ncbi:MAG: endolytic transglycosylase MltG [Nitrospirota bacterium]